MKTLELVVLGAWSGGQSEVRGRPAQDLVLHLEPAQPAPQLRELGLPATGLPIDDPVVDVGLLRPATD